MEQHNNHRKTKMKKIILITCFTYAVFALKAQTFNALLGAMLQDTLNTYVSQISNIKGMAASVYIPGQGVWTGVIRNSHAGKPITSDMRFGIASNSKLFASVMMLKLAENKIISLEDSIKDWITVSNSNINPNITIRQLLNHSSGISDPFFAAPWFDTINANPKRIFTPSEVLNWVGNPLFAKGTSYGYSNTNYVLIGMIAQSATGFSLAKLIRDSILNPLNMDSTFIDIEEKENGIIAHRWWNTIDYHDTSRVGLNSAVGYAGSIFSTSSEMAQWYHALFSGKVIKQTSLNELTTFIATSSPSYKYGLGLSSEVTQGYPYWGHGGSTWGYKSKMMYDSCLNIAVAGLSNSFPAGMDGVLFLLYRAVKNHIPGCSGVINGPVTVCSGTNSVTYSIPPIPKANSYSWSLPSGATGSSNSNSITINFGVGAISGNLKVTGINNYGPGGFSSIGINIIPKPTKPIITINGNVLTSNAASGNQWYNSSGKIAGANNPTYTINTNGTYYCIVTSLNCISDTSNIITTSLSNILETSFQNDLKIYPNPTSSQFTFETTVVLKQATLLVENCFGQTVSQMKNINGKTAVFSFENLPQGLYFVRILEDNKTIATKKLIIKN